MKNFFMSCVYTKERNKSNIYHSILPNFALLNEPILFFSLQRLLFHLSLLHSLRLSFLLVGFFIVTFLLFCYLLTRFFYLLVYLLTTKRMTSFLFISHVRDLPTRDGINLCFSQIEPKLHETVQNSCLHENTPWPYHSPALTISKII